MRSIDALEAIVNGVEGVLENQGGIDDVNRVIDEALQVEAEHISQKLQAVDGGERKQKYEKRERVTNAAARWMVLAEVTSHEHALDSYLCLLEFLN